MAKASTIRNAFNSGEFSPIMYARHDLDKYESGLKTQLNWLNFVQGGATRRPGTVFRRTTKFGGDRVSRLLSFEFSVAQTYHLEFGHLYVRFYINDDSVTETPKTIEAVTKANPGKMTITGHGYANGTRLHSSNTVGGMTQLRQREFIVANATANDFDLTDIYGVNVNTTNYDTFTSGGTVAKVLEVVTPYTEADLEELQVAQLNDQLYIFHPEHETAILARTTPTTWTWTEVDFLDGPYLDLNTTATTLTLSGTSGSVTVTASAPLFAATDVKRLIRWKDPAGNWTWLRITAFGTSTSVTALIRGPNASAPTGTVNWRLGQWSDTTGFPRAGTFFDDRLYAGGVITAPQRFDASRTGRYNDFQPTAPNGTVANDNAVSFTLASGDQNAILWMLDDEKGMLIGTGGGPWVVRANTLGEAITPTNVSPRRSPKFGSAPFQAIRAGGSALYVQRSQQKIRELNYVFENDGFRSKDITLLSEHLGTPGFQHMTYQQNPQPYVWVERSDGVLVCGIYSIEQNVVGWNRQVLGGVGDAQGGWPKVNSVVATPSGSASDDKVFMIVERYIGGRLERYIERLSKIWAFGDLQVNAVQLDSAVTVTSGSPQTVIPVGTHLEGEELSVYADGNAHPKRTVANGKITLAQEATKVTAGYAYRSDTELLPIEAGASDGVAQAKKRRITRIGFRLLDTLGFKYGRDETHLTEVISAKWGYLWGTNISLRTGVFRDRFEGTNDLEGTVFMRCDGPYPATLLAVMPQVITEDDT